MIPDPEEKWNPIAHQGQRWWVPRVVGDHVMMDLCYEVDRNKDGRVTLCPHYCWKSRYPMVTLDRKMSEILIDL